MPKQSRGFWICVFCDLSFDSYEEANYHEIEECQTRRRVLAQQQQQQQQGQHQQPPHPQQTILGAAADPTTAAAAAGGWPTQQQQQQQQPHRLSFPSSSGSTGSNNMAPLAIGEATPPPPHRQVAAVPMGMPPVDALEYEYRQQQQEPQQHHMQPQQQTVAGAGPRAPTRQRLRRFPLMRPDEPSRLSESDTVACRSIEVFEVSTGDLGDPGGHSGGDHRVGVRCMYCTEKPFVADQYDYPPSIGSVADSIRRISEYHLTLCASAPPSIRQLLGETVSMRSTKRKQQQEQQQQQQKRGEDELWHQQEESSRHALTDFCIMRCQQMGIVNRYPDNSGIIFHEASGTIASGDAATSTSAMMAGRQHYHHHHHHHHQQQQMPSSSATPTRPGEESFPPSPVASRTGQQQQQHQHYDAAFGHQGMAFGGETATAAPPSVASAPGSTSRYGEHHLDAAAVASSSMQPGTTPASASSRGYHHHHMPTSAPATQYPVPSNFPFYQDQNGDWFCRFCSHVPPQFRDQHHVWSAANKAPPPGHFIDYHLNNCREFLNSRGRFSSYHYHQQQHTPMSPGAHFTQQGTPSSSYPQPSQYGVGPSSTTPSSSSYGGQQQTPGGWDASMGQQQRRGQPVSGGRQFPSTGMSSVDLSPLPTRPAEADVLERSPGSVCRDRPDVTPPRKPDQMGGDPDISLRRAISYLVANDKSIYENDGTPVSEDARLVLDEDKLLLTDYFFYLMKQLRLVRFSESDRRTRGGKREKIQVGYGGLQCVHCSDAPNARKFFWSNVDRLANSFAEIPGHVLKCRRCPKPVKDALLLLKQQHPEQMARLPRGSQKVFFRRMWRRLHDEDPPKAEAEGGAEQQEQEVFQQQQQQQHHHLPPLPQEPATKSPPPPLSHERRPMLAAEAQELKPAAIDTNPSSTGNDGSPEGTSGSDESVLMFERSTVAAAKTLADSMAQAGPPSPSSRVLLAIPEDKQWLSDVDCFIRRQIEVFCATTDDVLVARADRKYPVHEGQVGIRCIHCALSKHGDGAKGQGVAYPFAISGIYESVREFQRLHLDSCENVPAAVSAKLAALRGSSSLSSVLRKYYILAATALGLQDTRDGIRAGGQSVPLGSQAAFAFSDSKPPSLQHEMGHSESPSSPSLQHHQQQHHHHQLMGYSVSSPLQFTMGGSRGGRDPPPSTEVEENRKKRAADPEPMVGSPDSKKSSRSIKREA